MPPTPTTTVTATVAIITDELPSSGGPATGHVVLGVLGGLVLVFIVVVVTVPLVRWRLYGKRRAPSEKSQSRASSRRTHVRIPSGREVVVEPLLEGKGKHLAVTGQWQGTDSEAGGSKQKQKQKAGGVEEINEKPGASKLSPDTPIRPPSAVFNWKILTTLPNFSDESLSSLGEPLEPGASNLNISKQNQASTATSNAPPPPPKQDIPTLEVITATNTTASMSRQSTLVADKSTVALVSSPVPLSPDVASPLTHAFTGPLSSSSSINTFTQSTFRYPSLSPSIATHGASSSGSAANHGHSSNGNHAAVLSSAAAPVIPDSLQAGKNNAESWWHIAPPMPSIPESSRSPSTPSSDTPDNRTSTGTARLRELFVAPPANVEPGTSSGHLQVASHHTPESSGDSRSPRLSMAGSIIVPAQDNSIIRQLSSKTHYTFGRPNSLVLNTPASDTFVPFTAPPALPPLPVATSSRIIPDQNTVPFPASSSPGHDQSFEAQQQRSRQHSNVIPRSRFSTPTMSSNGGDPDDISRKRQSYDYPREPSPPLVPTPLAHPPSRPSPVLKPQSEIVADASPSTAASTTPVPAPLRTPKLLLRPVSPLGFDDTLFSVSRTQTPAPGAHADVTGAVATTSQQGAASAAPSVPILPPPPPGKKRRARRKSTSSSSYSEHTRTASSTTTGSGSASGSRGSLKSRRSASTSQRMSRRVTFGIPPDSATRATFATQQSSESTAEPEPEPVSVSAPEVPPLPFVEPLRLGSPRRPGFSRSGSSEPWAVVSAPTSPTSTRPITRTGAGRETSTSPVSPLSPTTVARRTIRPLPIPPVSSPSTSPPLASPPFAARNEEEQPLINAPPDYDSSS